MLCFKKEKAVRTFRSPKRAKKGMKISDLDDRRQQNWGKGHDDKGNSKPEQRQ